jgi:hypothetical protein
MSWASNINILSGNLDGRHQDGDNVWRLKSNSQTWLLVVYNTELLTYG